MKAFNFKDIFSDKEGKERICSRNLSMFKNKQIVLCRYIWEEEKFVRPCTYVSIHNTLTLTIRGLV